MKKITIAIIFILAFSMQSFADEKNNLGYYETNGMVGIFASLPNFGSSDIKSRDISGGAFGYWNVINGIYGNFSIGVSANYEMFKQHSGGLKSNIDMQKVALNFAYMTSSDYINAWGGIAGTYSTARNDIKSYTETSEAGEVKFDDVSTQNYDLFGADAFVGLEYLFTENHKWGAFFEFRYSLVGSVSQKIPEYNFDKKLDLSRYSFNVGVSFHF